MEVGTRTQANLCLKKELKKMIEWKKIKGYDVKVEDYIVLNIVKPDGTPGYPYKFNTQQNAFVKVDNLTIDELKNGMYAGRIEIY